MKLKTRHKETPEKRETRLAKQRGYNCAWRAKNPEYVREQRASETPEQHAIRRAKQREYARERRVNETREQRKIRLRERNSRCLKPYPKSYRDRVLANYTSRGLTVSQRMLDELDGKRDLQTPPLFRRV